jgi:hypothetical protein
MSPKLILNRIKSQVGRGVCGISVTKVTADHPRRCESALTGGSCVRHCFSAVRNTRTDDGECIWLRFDRMKKLAEAVTLLICTREVACSNLGRDTDYFYRVFLCTSTQSLYANSIVVNYCSVQTRY